MAEEPEDPQVLQEEQELQALQEMMGSPSSLMDRVIAASIST